MKTFVAIFVCWCAGLAVLAGSAEAALVAHWKLNDDGPDTIVDATVGTDGTLLGGENTNDKSTTGPGGQILKAFIFNGSDDNVTIATGAPSFTSGQAFSYSLWVKFNSTSGGPGLFGQNAATTNRITANSDTSIRVTGSGSLIFTVPALGTTNWRHILVTRTSGNSARCFVDGVESSTGALSMAQSFSPTRIGLSNASYLNGGVAQAKIFDSDESANAAALYAEGTASAKPHIYYYQQSRLRPRRSFQSFIRTP